MYGSGHINDTYRLTYEDEAGEKRFILQKMNKDIFKKPEELMENVSHVTAWLRKKIQEAGGDPELSLIHIWNTRENRKSE